MQWQVPKGGLLLESEWIFLPKFKELYFEIQMDFLKKHRGSGDQGSQPRWGFPQRWVLGSALWRTMFNALDACVEAKEPQQFPLELSEEVKLEWETSQDIFGIIFDFTLPNVKSKGFCRMRPKFISVRYILISGGPRRSVGEPMKFEKSLAE